MMDVDETVLAEAQSLSGEYGFRLTIHADVERGQYWRAQHDDCDGEGYVATEGDCPLEVAQNMVSILYVTYEGGCVL